MGRHETRLFDEVLDGLQKSGQFINILRLKRMLRTEKFLGGRVLAAMAGLMSKATEVLKWKQLAVVVEAPLAPEGPFFCRGWQAVAGGRRTRPELPSIWHQARAHKEGVPYQTLIASVLHKYASGRLRETRSRLTTRPTRRAENRRAG